MASTAERVREIIAQERALDIEQVKLDSTFADLGADSLDTAEIVLALEEVFKINIDEDSNKIHTVGDVVEYIESKLAGRG